MIWGTTIIADMHARGDHRGCVNGCAAALGGKRGRTASVHAPSSAAALAPPSVSGAAANSKARPRMNKTETRWAARLTADPTVLAHQFEAVTLRLARDCRLTPDFLVVHADGALGFDEVKGGYIREDAAIKLKVAVDKYPFFRWRLCAWKDGAWNIKGMNG